MAASHAPATLLRAMRVTITCEDCGQRHRLERRINEPGPIWIICHSCELPLQATLEGPIVSEPMVTQPTQLGGWNGVLDFSGAA